MTLILDSIIFALQRAGGVSIYWAELLKRIPPGATMLLPKFTDNIFLPQIDLQKFSQVSYESLPPKISRYLPCRLPEKTFGKKGIFHSSYYRTSLNRNFKSIVTVHDFIYERHRRGLSRAVHHWQKALSIKQASQILCVSENTKKDLLYYFPRIPESIVTVVHNGAGDEYFPLPEPPALCFKRQDEQRPFILYLGGREPYKNFPLCLQVLETLPDYDFVVVGSRPFSVEEEGLIHHHRLSTRTYFVRNPSNPQLNVIFNHAHCLLYPSSCEGFGIPVAEAQKAHCPVITQQVSSLPEVNGVSVLMCDSAEADSFHEKIKLLENISFRKEAVNRGAQFAAKFTWDRCFQEIMAVYKKIENVEFSP